MTYVPAEDRYERMVYRRTGRSGLRLPAISLGMWWNFGHDRDFETGRAIVRRAFDLGVTHFDLANNTGRRMAPPRRTSGASYVRIYPFRHELVISTKAGYDMWPGPYGDGGSRSTSSRASTKVFAAWASTTSTSSTRTLRPRDAARGDDGRARHRRPAGEGALRGISSYSATKTREAAAILRELGTPFLIHQPSYSMLNRWIEPELLDTLEELGVGCITFSPLAQGMLTDKYLNGIPEGARASRPGYSLWADLITDESLEKIRALTRLPPAAANPLRRWRSRGHCATHA